MIGRRGFLSVLGGVAATAVLDPEYLLWVPGAKTFSIPPDPSWDAYYRGLSNAETLAAQREFIHPNLETLFLAASILWEKIQINSAISPIGGRRPSRVPFHSANSFYSHA